MVHVVLIDFHNNAPPPPAPVPAYVAKGEIFKFDAANWGAGVNFFHEATLKANTGYLYSRIFDLTADSPIVASTVSTNAAIFTRVRSPVIVLVNGNEYVNQFGVVSGDSGQYRGGKMIVV